MKDPDSWLVDVLIDLLDAVRRADTVPRAAALAVAEIAHATHSDVAAVILADRVVATAGSRAPDVAHKELLSATTAGPAADVAGLGRCDVAISSAKDAAGLRLVVLRRQGAIGRRERGYLDVAARTLSVTMDMLAGLDSERALRAESAYENQEHNRMLGSLLKRQQLLDNLGRIERSISRRIPLGEVLKTITDAVHQLLGDDLVLLRLLDPDDPNFLILVSDSGVSPDAFNKMRRTPIGAGAGGRAVSEDALVVISDYANEPAALDVFVSEGVCAAIAAPVHENGVVVGSLTIATYAGGRQYGPIEQESLLAFAEHVSLALTDARTGEAMQAAEQMKDNLLAMVSHELKTPLTVMLGVVQTIQRHAARLPDDVRDEMLTSAQERGYELGRLIDRLLDGAQSSASGSVQDASLPALVTAVVAPYASAGRHLLVPPVPPQPLRVDVSKLHGALSNLVESAIQHSPQHSPVVIETDVTDGMVTVTVTAQGELPDGPELDVLFGRGTHPPSSGLGLGLYLAEHLAGAAGATVSAGSTAGTMSFTLRFAAGATAATAARVPRAAAP